MTTIYVLFRGEPAFAIAQETLEQCEFVYASFLRYGVPEEFEADDFAWTVDVPLERLR